MWRLPPPPLATSPFFYKTGKSETKTHTFLHKTTWWFYFGTISVSTHRLNDLSQGVWCVDRWPAEDRGGTPEISLRRREIYKSGLQRPRPGCSVVQSVVDSSDRSRVQVLRVQISQSHTPGYIRVLAKWRKLSPQCEDKSLCGYVILVESVRRISDPIGWLKFRKVLSAKSTITK